MLVEMAVADAYAIPWEFLNKPGAVQQAGECDFKSYHQHPTYVELLPGQYTDDTQRAIANAEVMLQGVDWLFTPLSYASSYVCAYQRDQREGYSRGFQSLLNSIDSGGQLLSRVRRDRPSNGAVMGVAPMGFIRDLPSLKIAATIQAITTHHPSTAVHAQIVALAAHFNIYVLGHKSELLDFVVEHADWGSKDERTKWLGEVMDFKLDSNKPTTIQSSSISAYMVHTVAHADRLTDIMADAIRRGGDTDSAAATSVAVASVCLDMENDIPKNLIEDLDYANPEYGVPFLKKLESRLRLEFQQ